MMTTTLWTIGGSDKAENPGESIRTTWDTDSNEIDDSDGLAKKTTSKKFRHWTESQLSENPLRLSCLNREALRELGDETSMFRGYQ
jgi:hypothetical protein